MEKKYHHGDLKTELIENGLKMIQQDGIDKLSLRKLAKACGVSEAAPYSHFRNKDDCMKAIQEYTSDRLYEALETAYENSPDPTSPHAVFDMGIAYIRFFMENPTYFTFIFNQPHLEIDLSMKGQDEFKPFRFFRERCYEIYRKEGYDDERIKYGIISMWAKVHGIAAIASLPCVKTDFDWKDVLERVLAE